MSNSIDNYLNDTRWVNIPAGKSTVTKEERIGQRQHSPTQKVTYTIETDGCVMSHRAVTNAEFQTFVDASDGYNNLEWWRYEDMMRKRPPSPRPAIGDENSPRTNITFWTMVAYTRWLSAQTGELIRLPTEAEWKVAVANREKFDLVFGEQEWFISTIKQSVTIPHFGKGKGVRYGIKKSHNEKYADYGWDAFRSASPEDTSSKTCAFRLVRTGQPFEKPEKTIDVDAALMKVQSGKTSAIREGMIDLRMALDERSIPIMVELLKSDKNATCRMAMETLDILSEKFTIPAQPLVDMLGHRHPPYRSDAVDILVKLTSDEQRETITNATNHENKDVRYRIIRVLVDNLGDDAIPILREMQKRETDDVNKKEFVQQVKRLKSDEARIFLEDTMLNPDENGSARWNAAVFARDIGGKKSIPAFKKLQQSNVERFAELGKNLIKELS